LQLSYFSFSVALQALKRKVRYEKRLQQIDGMLSTIELQREALEGATSNAAVIQAMNEAAKSLKGVHQSL
jgi:charged multivesicular body protein 4